MAGPLPGSLSSPGRGVNVNSPPTGYKAFIDDNSGEIQIFVNASTGLVENARDWKVGDFIFVIGFAGKYEKTYEIMPRNLSDITIRAAQE